MARLLSRVHRVDGLVNIVGAKPNVERLNASTFGDGAIEGDFRLVLELTRAAYATWMRSHGGSITNVVGVQLERRPLIESIADALVLALTDELSAELAPHIDVNAVVGDSVAGELEYLIENGTPPTRIERRYEHSDIRAIAQAVVELQTAPRGAKNGHIVLFCARSDRSRGTSPEGIPRRWLGRLR